MQSKIKADGTHVTTADGDAEIAIRQALGTARPDDGFLGEEIGSKPSRNGRQWMELMERVVLLRGYQIGER